MFKKLKRKLLYLAFLQAGWQAEIAFAHEQIYPHGHPHPNILPIEDLFLSLLFLLGLGLFFWVTRMFFCKFKNFRRQSKNPSRAA